MEKEYVSPMMEIIELKERSVITESYGSDGDDDYGYWPLSNELNM